MIYIKYIYIYTWYILWYNIYTHVYIFIYDYIIHPDKHRSIARLDQDTFSKTLLIIIPRCVTTCTVWCKCVECKDIIFACIVCILKYGLQMCYTSDNTDIFHITVYLVYTLYVLDSKACMIDYIVLVTYWKSNVYIYSILSTAYYFLYYIVCTI